MTPSRVRVILEYNITPENSQFVPENRPGPQKEAGSFEKTNHFSGVCVNFRECFYLGVVTKNTSWLDDTKNVIFLKAMRDLGEIYPQAMQGVEDRVSWWLIGMPPPLRK